MKEGQECIRFALPLLKGNLILMAPHEIKYLRSDGPIVYIIDMEDQQIAGGQPLKFYVDLLVASHFYQVSQSIFVNLKKVRYIDVVNQEVELICGKRLSMSRSGLKNLKEFIKSQNYRW